MSERIRLQLLVHNQKSIFFFFINILKQSPLHYNMTVGCTRCGEQQDGDILNVAIAFKFPHKKGCGQGIGPLAVVPTNKVKKEPKAKDPDVVIKDVKVEEKPKKNKPIVEKLKVFGNKD